jgi:membrane protease YdiL (CAAX protease family)
VNPIVIASAKRSPAILRFLIAVLVVLCAYIVTGFVLGMLGRDRLGMALYASLLLLILLCGFCGLLLSSDGVLSPLLEAQGLPFRGKVLRDGALGLGFGVAMVSLVVAVVATVGQARFHYAGMHPEALAVTFWSLASAAMVEEITFRGYPLHRLMEAAGTLLAVAVTSCLFGLAHLRNPHATWWGVANTVEIGVLLGLAYVRTRSLWLPWGIHFGWNAALGMGYGLVVSGYPDFSNAVVGSLQGPRWLTGGAYGIEASLTATAVNLVAIVVLLLLVKQRPAPQVIVASAQQLRITPDSCDGS